MIYNIIEVTRDTESPKIHPTQKSIYLLKYLISIFTDEGDVVIDPVAGSGSTLVAANQMNRNSYGFEIKKEFYNKANDWIKRSKEQVNLFKPNIKQKFEQTNRLL